MTSALIMIFAAALLIGAVGIGVFLWAVSSGQYDDPEGDALRILNDDPQ